MAQIGILIQDKNGEVVIEKKEEGQVALFVNRSYEEGDSIHFLVPELNQFYIFRVDDTMDEALVYVTKPEINYVIPFGEKKISYNPKAFEGEKHYLTARRAESFEISAYRNLAKNVMDQHGDTGCYPHVHANVETRGEAVFAARNAIDGVLCNESHGPWPFESWGINRQDDAELTLEFGRPVSFDQLVLYTRADFPHDNWWVNATFTFSDGTSEVVSMEKSSKPHVFAIKKEGITWLTLSHLIKADDPSPFPALTQIEVYGNC